jgi:cell division protein FtsI (penicillin-binding protein 3)
MSEKNDEGIVLEDYENEFSYKKSKSNLNIQFNRVAFIFFVFFIISIIYTIQLIHLGSLKLNNKKEIFISEKKNYRADIIDNNGNYLVKTVSSIDIGISPIEVIDKKKLLINLKLIFPKKNFVEIKKKLNENTFFNLEKKITNENYEKIMLLGDKAIRAEEKLARIYPQQNLFSHIIGQIDDDNNGISGIEKSFDKQLKTIKEPLKLTVDTDVQFLIRKELIKFQEIFKSKGSAAILMDVNNGEILSMISLPDFNLNQRKTITDLDYINRATKGVYELGSVFKTFTIASGLNEDVIEVDTEFKKLPKRLKCEKNLIREYDDKIPSDLTSEQILIRSGNIGSVRIAQRVGLEKFPLFLDSLGLLDKIEFDIEEVGRPIPFRWGKCKLATSAFGHGITTTPLQLAKAYAIVTNGGYNVVPTLIKRNHKNKRERLIKKGVSEKLNPILRKIVSSKEGTANFANIKGYEIGGKTGTAQKVVNGVYSKNKVNTFALIFPTSKPKFVLIILMDEPKANKEYVYHFKDGSGWKYKGNWRNTAGWTSVEVAGKIIEKIGPILATKYIEID